VFRAWKNKLKKMQKTIQKKGGKIEKKTKNLEKMLNPRMRRSSVRGENGVLLGCSGVFWPWKDAGTTMQKTNLNHETG